VKEPIAGGGRRSSQLVNLLCDVFAAVLAKRQHPVDGVFHGSFGTERVDAGELTVADCWKILPYDNLLVTAELSAKELAEVVAEDAKEKKSDRTLWPFTIHFDAGGTPTQVLHRGREAKPDERFTIALNSYDSQSGGRRLMKLREILAKPDAKRSLTSIDTRAALVDGLLDRGEI
jgi:2',3'-cyclic-nucleotide 2'-phosphodiesterase (5'-nucleotidase family)